MSEQTGVLTERGQFALYVGRIEGAWDGLSDGQRRAILGVLRLVADTFNPRSRRTSA